jgi:putative phosphoesterase
MLFAVASDLHGQWEHWRRLWRALKAARPDGLILCGDLGNPEDLKQMGLQGLPWAFCLGNCDQGRADAFKDVALEAGATAWGELGLWSLGEEGGVAFTHFPAVARRTALEGRHRAVFYGHTHRPAVEWLETPGGRVLLANPGDVEGRYGRVSGLLWDSRDDRVTPVEA